MANNLYSTMPFNFKVVLLGEGCVGKTSIVLRYVEDKFTAKHISTLQASFLNKKLTLAEGRKVQLNIWDTAGQERFHALGPIYYRGSHGAILVYDITDQESFQKVKNWVKELKRMLGDEIVISIVGNKTDLDMQRTISYDDAEQYTQSVGAHYYETSAKNNDGIEDLFISLSTLMTERYTQREQESNSLRLQQAGRTNNRLVVEDSLDDEVRTETPSATRSCCGSG